MHLPRFSLLPHFVREVRQRERFPREPEPDLVMDDPEQVSAYREAGRIDGTMAASYLFQTAHISQVIQGCRVVLDLGCGPATQLAQIAQLNPDISFIGADLSPGMLDEARTYVARLGITNIRFIEQDITELSAIDTQSVDGVISTMALHHLPTLDHLRRCLQEVRRVLRPNGAIYLTDFSRLKSLKTVLFFAYMNADRQPFLFSRDYERSLRAAFTEDEFRTLTAECLPAHISMYATFKMPFLVAIKSEDRPLPEILQRRLFHLVEELPRRYRNDLDDMRIFFSLGGLADPFSASRISHWMAKFHMAQFAHLPLIDHVPHSFLERSWRIGRSAFRLYRLLAQHRRWQRRFERVERLQAELRRESAEQLASTLFAELGSLKGLMMKFGQMASYVGENVPEPVKKALAPLQQSSPPISGDSIVRILEAEFQQPIGELFAEWYDAPIAAASISQLHLAVLPSGERVIVKVKYPNIENAIRADFLLLRLVSPLLTKLLRVSNLGTILRELERQVMSECDFLQEAKNQETFARAFSDDREIVIPKLYPELSTRNVLTMEYIEGARFDEFRRTANQAEKNMAAEIIARKVILGQHKHAIFNADPHPGNYLFLAGRVCFLDFGFTTHWPREFINLSKRYSLAGYRQDRAEFIRLAKELGYATASGDERFYDELLQLLRRGTYGTWLEDRPFHFTREFVREEHRAMAEFYRRWGPLEISSQQLALQRVFWGHHSIFAELDAEVNLHRLLVPLLEQPLAE